MKFHATLFFFVFVQIRPAKLEGWIRTECLVPINDPPTNIVPHISTMPKNPQASAEIRFPSLPITTAPAAVEKQENTELICQNISTIGFEAEKRYKIESAADDSVIDLEESVKSQKTPIIAYVNHGGENQLWTATHSQSAFAFNLLTEVRKNNLLKEALTYDSYRNMTLLRHMTDGPSQQWYIGNQCGHFVQLRSNSLRTGSNCLTQMGTGVPLTLRHCDDLDRNQLWHLNMVET